MNYINRYVTLTDKELNMIRKIDETYNDTLNETLEPYWVDMDKDKSLVVNMLKHIDIITDERIRDYFIQHAKSHEISYSRLYTIVNNHRDELLKRMQECEYATYMLENCEIVSLSQAIYCTNIIYNVGPFREELKCNKRILYYYDKDEVMMYVENNANSLSKRMCKDLVKSISEI